MALYIVSQSITQDEALKLVLFCTEDMIANAYAVCYHFAVAP
jgi:hypothetical protein